MACRTRRPQQMLLRVVRTLQGSVCVDSGQHRSAGRGAYVCVDEGCIRQAERRHAFRRPLRADVPDQVYVELRHAAAQRCDAQAE
ncbi:MAG: YlxR family protein [Armatimonadota bacterium]